MARLGFLRLLWVLTIVLASTALAQDTLPQVDLGYEIHQAISFNVSICMDVDTTQPDSQNSLLARHTTLPTSVMPSRR